MATAVMLVGPGSTSGAVLSHEQRIVALTRAQEAFDRGVQLARRQPTEASAAFRSAANDFEAVIESGVRNGRLYYNLANAQLQLNDLGHAIANYRRAEKLIPADERLRTNLAQARGLRRSQFEPPALGAVSRALFFWHYHAALRWRFAALLVTYTSFWLVLILRTFVPRWRWRYALATIGLLGAVLAASVAASAYDEQRRIAGVVTADDVTVRKGNGEGYEPRFEQPLHAGVEFELIDRRVRRVRNEDGTEQVHDWLYIRLPDGRDGWIRASEAEII